MDILRPTPQQLRFLNWEFGVFFHFGIRTFFPAHQDWDGQPMNAKAFNPSQLDCDSWIRTIKQAGARYAVLTAKHHDGFALWPTQYSRYGVHSSAWRAGQGDVVREFVYACRAHGLGVGLYYSPAQWGEGPAFKAGKAYDDYFIAQVGELLSNYGPIDYLWFDGAFSQGHRYDKPRIVRHIRALQPDILLFNLWDPDTLWVGNEAGYASLNNHNVRQGLMAEQTLLEIDQPDAVRFLPAECDTKMRDTWFYAGADDQSLKSLEELLGMWDLSVGRGANLLLNIGPDDRGLLPEPDAQRLLDLGEAVKARFASPLPFSWQRKENTLLLESDSTQAVSRVVLTEDLCEGQHIQSFQVYWHDAAGTAPVLLYQGSSVGHKAICSFPTVRTEQLQVVCDPPASIGFVASAQVL